MAFRDWLVIIILGIGWGLSFLFNAILLRELGPLSVSFGRVALGALGCWAYLLLLRADWRVTRPLALRLLAFGILSYAAPFTFYALGQQHIASGVAGIVNATTPALAVVVAHLWPQVWGGGERATALKSAGVLCGLMGIVVLSWPILSAGAASAVWAIGITLCAPLCYAVSVNVAKAFRGLEPVVLVAWAMTGAALGLLPLSLAFDGMPAQLSLEALGALAVIGFVLTSAAFIAFYWVLPRVGPTNVTLPTLIAPASAVLAGVYVLGEPFALSHAVGLGVIVLGLLLIDGRLFRALWARLSGGVG